MFYSIKYAVGKYYSFAHGINTINVLKMISVIFIILAYFPMTIWYLISFLNTHCAIIGERLRNPSYIIVVARCCSFSKSINSSIGIWCSILCILINSEQRLKSSIDINGGSSSSSLKFKTCKHSFAAAVASNFRILAINFEDLNFYRCRCT